MVDRVGQQLGNYYLIRLLGRGGFAEVYLGEHLRLKTQAAIKILHTSLEDDDVEDFLREAQMVAHLKHPHIVRVFDFDVENHTPFLVMDYLSNGNVRRSYPKGTSLPSETVVSYVKQVASALQYAHDQKLIHRDIKPENMLLDRDNTIVLSDFGIALMAQSSRYQSTQEVAGTAAYMAPEQFQGHPHRASDQYALGIVVYEWLTGDRPFHGSFTEIASQHLFVPPPLLREKVPMISSEVEQVVLIALEKDPQKRFSSVQVFATALEQACQPTSSHQVALPKDVPLPSELLLLSDGIIAASPGQTLFPTEAVTLQRQSLQATIPVISPDQSLQATIPAISSNTSAPPAHSTRKFVLSGRPRSSKRGITRRTVLVGLAGLAVVGSGITWLSLSHLSFGSVTSTPTTTLKLTPTPTPLLTPTPSSPPVGTTYLIYRGHSDIIDAVVWSPNGKHIASSASYYDQTVQIWEATSGRTIFTFHGAANTPNNIGWSPDNKYIAFASFETVQVWDAVSGNSVYTYSNPGAFTVAWSPKDNRIASSGYVIDQATNRFVNNTVHIWNATTGSTVLNYKGHSDVVYAVAWSPDGKRIASASQDKTAQVWNAFDGSNVYIYSGHGYMNAVAWSPDGKRIASGAGYINNTTNRFFDTTIEVWQAS